MSEQDLHNLPPDPYLDGNMEVPPLEMAPSEPNTPFYNQMLVEHGYEEAPEPEQPRGPYEDILHKNAYDQAREAGEGDYFAEQAGDRAVAEHRQNMAEVRKAAEERAERGHAFSDSYAADNWGNIVDVLDKARAVAEATDDWSEFDAYQERMRDREKVAYLEHVDQQEAAKAAEPSETGDEADDMMALVDATREGDDGAAEDDSTDGEDTADDHEGDDESADDGQGEDEPDDETDSDHTDDDPGEPVLQPVRQVRRPVDNDEGREDEPQRRARREGDADADERQRQDDEYSRRRDQVLHESLEEFRRGLPQPGRLRRRLGRIAARLFEPRPQVEGDEPEEVNPVAAGGVIDRDAPLPPRALRGETGAPAAIQPEEEEPPHHNAFGEWWRGITGHDGRARSILRDLGGFLSRGGDGVSDAENADHLRRIREDNEEDVSLDDLRRAAAGLEASDLALQGSGVQRRRRTVPVEVPRAPVPVRTGDRNVDSIVADLDNE